MFVLKQKPLFKNIILLAIVTVVYSISALWTHYKLGQALFKYGFVLNLVVILWFVYVLFLVAFLVVGIYKLIVFIVKADYDRFYQQILLMTVFILIVMIGFVVAGQNRKFATKGLLKTMQRCADIPAIQLWLDKKTEGFYKNAEDEYGVLEDKIRLEEAEWPDVIKKLMPRYIVLDKNTLNQKYVKLVWGSGMLGSYGLTVGLSSKEFPNNTYIPEYRLPLGTKSFVWHRLRK